MTMRYLTNCVHSTGALIDAMTTAAREITRRTFLKAVDHENLAVVEASLGYDTGTERGGLRMSKDWHVGYYRSTYDDRPCVYFAHSHIEYIFVEPRS